MSHSVFPQQKPSMSLEQAFAQTIAYCQAGQWQQAEALYQSIVLAQPSPVEGQYWLSYIDALIQAGKPRTAAQPSPAPAAPPALTPESQEVHEEQEAQAIRLARAPNPRYTARQARWPWKMALGCAHVPGRGQSHLLLAHYRHTRYDAAETLARELTRAFPRHDLGWKVLAAALWMQGRTAEAQQVRQQRRINCHGGRRKNRQPAP